MHAENSLYILYELVHSIYIYDIYIYILWILLLYTTLVVEFDKIVETHHHLITSYQNHYA